jgi:4'-phosphopantetheinyl transferase EntD
VIETLLPRAVVAVEAFEDEAEAHLLPEEKALVGAAVDSRRREFATGRSCARRALAQLGVVAGPIVAGAAGEPVWPPGVVGSITHCLGYRAAVVANATHVATVGIDAEPNAPLPTGVVAAIASKRERMQVLQLGAENAGVSWERLLFSAKESAYKAWYPLALRWLDFDEADVTLHPMEETFGVKLLSQGLQLPDGRSLSDLNGRWAVRDGLILTAIAVSATRVAADR